MLPPQRLLPLPALRSCIDPREDGTVCHERSADDGEYGDADVGLCEGEWVWGEGWEEGEVGEG